MGESGGTEAAAAAPRRGARSRTISAIAQRLRRRLLEGGTEALPDYELLEFLLFTAQPRGDMKPLAKALLERFGEFRRRAQRRAGRADGRARHGRGVGSSAQGGARGGPARAPRRGREAAGAVILAAAARLLPGRGRPRRDRGVPSAVPRPQERADRRRAPAARHHRPHAGLSARGGEARARARRLRASSWCTTIPPAIPRPPRPTSR